MRSASLTWNSPLMGSVSIMNRSCYGRSRDSRCKLHDCIGQDNLVSNQGRQLPRCCQIAPPPGAVGTSIDCPPHNWAFRSVTILSMWGLSIRNCSSRPDPCGHQ